MSIQFQSLNHAEPVTERRGKLTRTRGSADQREMRQIYPYRTRRRTVAHYDIESVILHCGVQYLLDLTGKPVYLIDKQHIVRLQIRQQRCEIARLFDSGSRGYTDIHSHFIRDYARQRGLAKSGRSVQQNVIQTLAALFRRLDIYRHILLDLVLTYILGKGFRAERQIGFAVRFVK